jgi:hypothetical protein
LFQSSESIVFTFIQEYFLSYRTFFIRFSILHSVFVKNLRDKLLVDFKKAENRLLILSHFDNGKDLYKTL